MTDIASPMQVTEVHSKPSSCTQTHFDWFVSLHLRSQMVFLRLCSDETTPESILYSCIHDRMHYVRTLVYSVECSGYCCVHKLSA